MANLFNNPDVLMSSWYALMPSRKLKKGQVKKIVLLDRLIAVFRTEDGQVYAFDSRCPHLGADLSRGCVIGNRLRCEFHHWAFEGNGECQEIPYMSDIPKSAKVFSYPIEEQYGFIWLFNGPHPTFPIPFFKTWNQDHLVPVVLPKMIFNCYSHIATCNGLDIQHMKSLHNMELLEDPDVKEINEYRIQVKYKIAFTGNSLMDRITRFFLGKSFILDFMTWSGNMAMGEVPHKDWPILMMFNHIPLTNGGTQCQPFLFLPKNKIGFLKANYFKIPILLLISNHFLVDDVGLFNSIKFWPRLVEKDEPLRLFIQQVNRMSAFKP